ncbi:MAG TPA: 30S ribosomal protein S6 [Thermoleophilia bacterium]|nr:30S ribosomal protein S6 [Thermoleophilia bacterium]
MTELNSYELMLILRPDTVDEARAAILDRIKEIVAADQGVMGKIDEWGKRRFAYEIAHMTEGYYYVMYFNVEPKTLDEITRVLGITDAVVRNMPVRLEDPVAPVAAVAAVAATTTEE